MPNPWTERRILAYAHQGGAREEPSSTLHAMRQAVARGATAIELDVHATRDGVLVVCHDPTVDRTTGASGRIADLTWDEVRALDNAYWFVPGEVVAHDRDPADYPYRGRAPDDPAFGIPRLDEVLVEFAGVPINLDIKETAPTVPGYEELLADVLRATGRADSDDVIVASFHDIATTRFSKHAPEVAVSLGTEGTAGFYGAVRTGTTWQRPATGARYVALQVPPTFGTTTVVDREFVERAHEEGLAVHVWTIDDPGEMRRLLDLDVDGIMTDVPSVLADVLGERGAPAR